MNHKNLCNYNALGSRFCVGFDRDPQERVGTHYPLHSFSSNRNTEVVTKRMRVDAHFKDNITSTQCFESSRIEER